MARLIALFTALCLQQSLAWADTAPSAKQTTERFYTWYLKTLASDGSINPLTDKPADMKKYVADALLADLNKQASSAEGLDEDYFIKGPDYEESWVGHVKVTEQASRGNTVTEDVVLGNDVAESIDLTVELTKSADGWRISKVEGNGTDAD
ncbi:MULTISPECIES: DUF3828 domain-containing protein [unclassified Pseudomonas]|uniref:DUF3828 domain-containing protein n=1 Tax=unclassified Pseudomonas TaxID=196821 RepID=UPI000BD740E8|nr:MULTISPECIES: DUF3828 domain-containing protein [unclassified Pseudomonas]PVZ10334.1 uncharacterized protein DUF3828 [Pseudomonas sp. URIL14HWK12:I12]PVZ21760.1 uncharacterized protein DUF3828 [Pseudomonas sp. URIL14HWK12:I10]PVZ31157.1 uncharacterized protein DUF3828 [Pseudomonas sp. URIL14HWK12:I11]SNZ17902.1 Protein of unknown function [Pseudomonas sp. URIL14HWK12:I9]